MTRWMLLAAAVFLLPGCAAFELGLAVADLVLDEAWESSALDAAENEAFIEPATVWVSRPRQVLCQPPTYETLEDAVAHLQSVGVAVQEAEKAFVEEPVPECGHAVSFYSVRIAEEDLFAAELRGWRTDPPESLVTLAHRW